MLSPLGLGTACVSAPENAPQPEPAAPIFTDETESSGLDFLHFNSASGRFYFPEMGGPGGALFDFDGDGDLDLYAVQGQLLGDIQAAEALRPPDFELRDRLYRNDLGVDDDGRPVVRWTDVTDTSGIDARGYGMGAATGDIDNDGWTDLYVTNFGANQLWRNHGDGTFEDITAAAGADDARWSTSAAFLDFDRDGWLDLFVTTYVQFRLGTARQCKRPTGRPDYCGPQAYAGDHDRLLRNRGDGTFEDVTARAGLLPARGSGLGVATADFDDDGWIDLYVANDLMPNFLWSNQGLGGSDPLSETRTFFTENGLLAGAALNNAAEAEASMGVAAADLDNDGDEDLFMAHLATETSTLYLNDGQALFEDRTRQTRMRETLAFTGFGTVIFDVDNDGWLDLASVNGAVVVDSELEAAGDPFPFGQSNQLFRNLGTDDGGLAFEEITARAGEAFSVAEISRGLARGDVDNDGDADLVVFNAAGPARLLINRLGDRQHWLGLRVLDSNRRDALGAKVELEWTDGSRWTRRVATDGSYCSANDPRLLFGLGTRSGESGQLTVDWPDGRVESFAIDARDRYHDIVQGTGAPIPQ